VSVVLSFQTLRDSHMRRDEVRQLIFCRGLGAGAIPNRAKNVAHGLIRKAMTHILQSACDAIISPTPILASHSEDQFDDFSTCPRSTGVVAALGAIKLLCDPFAIPGQDGFWFCD
jgi:hypothetical protein